MKITINKKRYNTDKMTCVGHIDHYSYSNNYAGTTYLMLASDGQLVEWLDSNGMQDCYLTDNICAYEDSETCIDDYEMDEEEEEAAIQAGLISSDDSMTIVDAGIARLKDIVHRRNMQIKELKKQIEGLKEQLAKINR